VKVLFLYKYEYLEPIGIMALSAVLKQHGHQVEFVDLELEKDYHSEILRIDPGVIAYSVTTGRHRFYQQLNLELKRKLDFFAVFGGPHVTYFPDFVEEDGVDAICRGEGEYPLLELVEALEQGRDHTGIENLWVKSGGEIVRNDFRPLIHDLDSLPYVDRELLSKYNSYRKLRRRLVLTGRGCPYKCAYCFNHAYNSLYKGKGKVIRRRSVENVIGELKQIRARHRARRFHFVDDTFILQDEWTFEFCERYRRELGLPFICYTRANLVEDEVVRALKEAGCIVILYAIEAGNEYIRNQILKRNISDEQLLRAAAIFKKHGLRTYVQNMVGLPDETLEMAYETVTLNQRCKPDYAWCSIFQPYPGTDLWEYSKAKGYVVGDSVDDFDESYHSTSIMNIPHRRQIENLHHLFSLSVSIPVLFPLVKRMIRWPFRSLYYLLFNLHRVWSYVLKVKWIDLSDLFNRE